MYAQPYATKQTTVLDVKGLTLSSLCFFFHLLLGGASDTRGFELPFLFAFTNRARRIKLTYYGVNVTDSETHLPLFRGRSPIEEEAEAQSKKSRSPIEEEAADPKGRERRCRT